MHPLTNIESVSNLQKKQFPSTILQAILSIFGGIVFVAPLIFLEKPLKQFISRENFYTLLGTTGILFIWGLLCFINWRKGNKISYSFKLPHQSSLLWFSIFLIIVFQIGMCTPLALGIRKLLDMKIPIDNPFQYPLISLVSILVIAPVLEELIFRGIILKGFLLHYPVSKAIGYTTILFGLVHGSPPLIAGAMLSGLYFAWIYYKTRSVGTTILLHITTNLAGLFGGFLRFQLSDHSEWFNLYGRYSMLIITGSSILFIILLIQVLKHTEKEKTLVF